MANQLYHCCLICDDKADEVPFELYPVYGENYLIIDKVIFEFTLPSHNPVSRGRERPYACLVSQISKSPGGEMRIEMQKERGGRERREKWQG